METTENVNNAENIEQKPVPKKPIRKQRPLTRRQREKLEEQRATVLDKVLKQSIFPLGVIFFFVFMNFIKPWLEKVIPDAENEFMYCSFKENESIKFRFYLSTYKELQLHRPKSYKLIAESGSYPYHVKYFRETLLETNYTLNLNPKVFSNKTERYWVLVASSETCDFKDEISKDGRLCFNSYWSAPIVRWEEKMRKNVRNLVFDEVQEEDTDQHPYTYENVTFDIVYTNRPIKTHYLAHHNYMYIRFSEADKFFICPVSENRYMHVPIHRTWLNETEDYNITYNIKIQLKKYLLWDQQLAMDDEPRPQMKKVVETIKIASVDNPPWLFWGYIALTFTKTIMKIVAFKEDIEMWSSIKNFKGISARSICFELFSGIIFILYIYDEHKNYLEIAFIGFGVISTSYKLFKLYKPIMDWPYFEWQGGDDPETRQFDEEAGKYAMYGFVPLLIGYTIYSFFSLKFTGFVSFAIKTTFNFVVAFGFLRMFPQIWLNYKLKTVAGISKRVLIYKLISTFIDDIHSVVMDMPLLYKITCFRDDFVFFIWVYQYFHYEVDATRANEYGEILEKVDEEEPENNEEEEEEFIKPIPAKSQQKVEEIKDDEDEEFIKPIPAKPQQEEKVEENVKEDEGNVEEEVKADEKPKKAPVSNRKKGRNADNF